MTAHTPRVQFCLLLALGVVGPLITLAGIYWVPESPRWLAWQGRRDEAWEGLRKLHYDPVGDPNEEASQAEFQQIVLQVEHDKKENVTFLKMFTAPSWRRRSLTAMFLLFATQSTGILAIGNFQLLPVAALSEPGLEGVAAVAVLLFLHADRDGTQLLVVGTDGPIGTEGPFACVYHFLPLFDNLFDNLLTCFWGSNRLHCHHGDAHH